MFLTPSSAFGGPNAEWAAKFEGQSNYLTLESGQFAQSQFTARNVGTGTWDKSFVNLATVNPAYSPTQARVSQFEVPGTWLTPDRPTRLDQQTVPSDGVGTFTFKIRAPQVQARTEYEEHFAPVAEGRAWMGCDDGCQWAEVWLRYTVYPPQDPTLAILPGPRTLVQGEPIAIAATAGDNVALNRVEFSLDDQLVVAKQAPFAASFSSAGLSPGAHVVTAKAFDNAGRSRTDTATFQVNSPPPPLVDPNVGVTINAGAQWTKTPQVQLSLRPPPGATGATVSNDGLTSPLNIGLSGEPVQVVPWRLASSGPERLPKTVYVHFTGAGIDAAKQHTDDIILDETRPVVSRARVVAKRHAGRANLRKPRCSRTRLTLATRAHDNLSGLETLTYRFNGQRKGTSIPFSTRVPIKMPRLRKSPRSMDIVVVDGAGNLSKSRSVSLRRVCH